VVRFRADCSRYSLRSDRIATVPCQTETPSLESLYEFYSLAHSVPSVSSECVSPATVALGFYSQRKLG
jgi:hypothetical protein